MWVGVFTRRGEGDGQEHAGVSVCAACFHRDGIKYIWKNKCN
jgi:hypothetical protein